MLTQEYGTIASSESDGRAIYSASRAIYPRPFIYFGLRRHARGRLMNAIELAEQDVLKGKAIGRAGETMPEVFAVTASGSCRRYILSPARGCACLVCDLLGLCTARHGSITHSCLDLANARACIMQHILATNTATLLSSDLLTAHPVWLVVHTVIVEVVK